MYKPRCNLIIVFIQVLNFKTNEYESIFVFFPEIHDQNKESTQIITLIISRSKSLNIYTDKFY